MPNAYPVTYNILDVSTTDLIDDAKWTQLFTAVNQERARWGYSAVTNPGFSGQVQANDYNVLLNGLTSLPSNVTGTPVAVTQLITANHINTLIDKLQASGAVCGCDCNYCTCDCNYCTCDCNYCTCNCNYACTCNCNYSCTCNCNYSCTCNCNYCTCNCNYCTCNCNYACTCDCNYSDMRLKTDIKMVAVESGINMYEWRYVWDDVNTRRRGVMAQDLVDTIWSGSLSVDDKGYYMVDYNQLPVSMTLL